MKRQLIILIVIILAVTFMNLDASESSGKAGYQFLRTYTGARPSALAGAFVSFSGDIHAIYFNPSGLAELGSQMVSASYLNHVLDFQSGSVMYSRPLRRLGQGAIAVNYMNYGEFDETDINGNKVGTFNAGSFVITSSLARLLTDKLLIGASAKFIHSTISTYSSSAIAIDLGAIYHLSFIEDMNVGVAVLNLGTALTAFVDEKDPLPLNLVVGFSKKLAHLPLEYSVSVNKYIDDDVQVNVGGEFTLSEGMFLRVGYNSLGRDQKIGADGDQFAGISMGLGVNWRDYQLDYGLSSYGAIGYLNRLTFSYQF